MHFDAQQIYSGVEEHRWCEVRIRTINYFPYYLFFTHEVPRLRSFSTK